MPHQTHYEVLAKQSGHWELFGRHSQSEKEQAIEEAKALDGQKYIQSVKVIQEIYDPEDGTSREYNVYSSGKKRYHPPHKLTNKKPDKEVQEKIETDRHDNKKKSSRSFASTLVNIALISGFSAIVGALFTWFTGMYLAEADMSDNAQSNILFLVFLATFVVAAIPMAIVFLGKDNGS